MPSVTNGLDLPEIEALRAAFASRDIAIQAWEAIRRRYAFKTMPDPVARLCGQIYRNVALSGGHPDRDRLRGAFKANHVYGTLQLTGAMLGLNELQRQGIPYLIVKGAAVALHVGTFGVRRLGDIDVAISIHDVERARRALAGVGFLPKHPELWDVCRRTRWRSCGPFVDASGAELDLMVSGTSCSDLIAIFLSEQISPVSWMEFHLKVVDPAQALILSLLHGFEGSAESDFVQSLADVLLLMKIVDPRRLHDVAERCRLGFMVNAALGLLFDLGLLDLDQRLTPVMPRLSHARIRSRVLRCQGRNREGFIQVANRLRRRWRGFQLPGDVPRGLGVRSIAYRVWLIGFQIAVVERLFLRMLGTLVPRDRILKPVCGETLWIDSDPSAWDFRFRLEWPDSEARAVSLISDFESIDGRALLVYESGRFRGVLPGLGSSPLVLIPAGERRAIEASIRLPEHPMPDRKLRCWLRLECG